MSNFIFRKQMMSKKKKKKKKGRILDFYFFKNDNDESIQIWNGESQCLYLKKNKNKKLDCKTLSTRCLVFLPWVWSCHGARYFVKSPIPMNVKAATMPAFAEDWSSQIGVQWVKCTNIYWCQAVLSWILLFKYIEMTVIFYKCP